MLWISGLGAMSTVSAPASSSARRGSVSSTFSTPSVARIATRTPFKTRSFMDAPPARPSRKESARLDHPEQCDRHHTDDHACEQAASPGDRRDHERGRERLPAVRERACRGDDRRANKRRDDRDGERLEIA